MLSAGLLAKKAVEAGLSVAKFVRRSLCPGSGIVTAYLQESGVMPYLHMLGFEVMGYGCSACVENSRKPALAAETDRPLMEAIRYIQTGNVNKPISWTVNLLQCLTPAGTVFEI
jgi:aconitase A